jgi:hypothetical protein
VQGPNGVDLFASLPLATITIETAALGFLLETLIFGPLPSFVGSESSEALVPDPMLGSVCAWDVELVRDLPNPFPRHAKHHADVCEAVALE